MAVPLSQLQPGQWATIQHFSENAESGLRSRLQEIGIAPGCLVQLMRKAPHSGPIQIRVGEAFLGLRLKDAQCLQVTIN